MARLEYPYQWYQEHYFDEIIQRWVCTVGALKFVVTVNDSGVCHACTKGFHDFYLKDGTLMGAIGAKHEIVHGVKPHFPGYDS